MGLIEERLQQTVQRCFGHQATLRGSFGTVQQPGRLEIAVGNKAIGIGPTFQEALQAAHRQLARTGRAVAPLVAFGVVVLW